MAKRKNVKITVFSGERYDGDWPAPEYDTSLADVIAWFQARLDSIPEEYRAMARCEISSESGYEGPNYPSIEIDYWRPETDEEMAARLAREALKRDACVRKEIAQLQALQAKIPRSLT